MSNTVGSVPDTAKPEDKKITVGTIKWKTTDGKVELSANDIEWLDSKMIRKDLIEGLKKQLFEAKPESEVKPEDGDKKKDEEDTGFKDSEGEKPETPTVVADETTPSIVSSATDTDTDATGAVGNATGAVTGAVGSAIGAINPFSWGSTPPQPPATSLDASNPSSSPPPPPKLKKEGGKKSKKRTKKNKVGVSG
jgi:hypothetical protein